MTIYRLYLSVIILFLSVASSSQPVYQAVKRGDPVPDVRFSVRPAPGQATVSLRLSDFRGKLILLDFWGANCVPCIKAFPKMAALEKEFRDSLRVLLVNRASTFFVDSIFRLRSRVSKLYQLPRLAQANGDSLFHQLFPHSTIPHYVWIGPDGRFLNQTHGDEVHAGNIRAVLQGAPLSMTEKKDLYDHDISQPMLPQLLLNNPDQIRYYSGFSGWNEGLPAGLHTQVTDSLRNTIRITRAPANLLAMVTAALYRKPYAAHPFENERFDFGKRVVLELKDSGLYLYPEHSGLTRREWDQLHEYGYEGVFPLSEKDRVYEHLLTDILQTFGLEGRIEKRKARCLALVRTSTQDKIRWTEGADLRLGRIYTDTSGLFHLRKTGTSSFRLALARAHKQSPYLFADQTNYKGLIQLELRNSLTDIGALRKELQEKYDLDLVESEDEFEFIIFRDLH